MSKMHVKLTVNGRPVEALAEPRTLLVHFLREDLNLTGAHIGCETSHCGACTVDLDGRSVKACTIFVGQANGAEVTTIEGIAEPDGTLNVLQEMFREHLGFDSGPSAQLDAELIRLRKRARRLIWLNPLKGGREYAPISTGMQTALPHVDAHLPARSLSDLAGLAAELERL